MRGVFPGSFDPLTVAHLAIADAAVSYFGLDRLDLVFEPRFANNARRVEHREELEAILEPLFKRWRAKEPAGRKRIKCKG